MDRQTELLKQYRAPHAMHADAKTLSLRFNGHFPGEPRLAGVY